jgi:hypothetical protein
MLHFYDGQLRRYITQTIRFFSNFVVKYGDGSLHRIPVLYGDQDRQVASVIRQNSENIINAAPRIAIYISGLELDRDRLADATYVGKSHFRDRDIDPATNTYLNTQGRNYTVEKIMPTPFKLSMKVDIWAASTDQKFQILEQILIFFNPSVELQTSDNYLDWTSLTVLNLDQINWSSRQVPVGNNLAIDIATLTIDTPIWLSAPVKVKQLGVITNIITSLYGSVETSPTGYIEGLGIDTAEPTITFSDLLSQERITIDQYSILVYGNAVSLLGSSVPSAPLTWSEIIDLYPGKFVSGVSSIYLLQPDNSQIVGTISLDPVNLDNLIVSWDTDTLVSNTGIDSTGKLDYNPGYNATGSYRPGSTGTFDAIVNPLTYNPKRPNNESIDQLIVVGTRFLIVEDIGSELNEDGPDAWKSTGNIDFIAHANDIIEWSGTSWNIIFNSTLSSNNDVMIWQTNIYTGVQYLWNGISWVKSFDGEYSEGKWHLVL